MIAIILYYYIYLIIYRGKTKASRSKGRGRTKAKDVSDLFARSSPLFCSVCCPRRPHHRQPLIGSHHQQRRGKSGHPARLWVDAIATTSPPIDQQPEWQSLVLSVILPASSSLLFRLLSSPSAPSPAAHRVEPSTKERDGRPPRPVLGDAIATLHQVVRVGKRAIQGGRSPPAHPADPLHPAGVPSAYSVKFFLSSENQGHCRAVVGLF